MLSLQAAKTPIDRELVINDQESDLKMTTVGTNQASTPDEPHQQYMVQEIAPIVKRVTNMQNVVQTHLKQAPDATSRSDEY